MMVDGRKTTIENVTVKIDPVDVLRKIYRDSIPSRVEFIGPDGHWYKSDGFDYHKREDLYVKDRVATKEELAMKAAYDTLVKYVKDNGL